MCDTGFVRFGNKEGTKGEYWHYEYKTSRWEKGTKRKLCAYPTR
jgi:hypothetical protein